VTVFRAVNPASSSGGGDRRYRLLMGVIFLAIKDGRAGLREAGANTGPGI
jgi:hypothetical protein